MKRKCVRYKQWDSTTETSKPLKEKYFLIGFAKTNEVKAILEHPIKRTISLAPYEDIKMID
jgi:hypothetical protein